MFTFFNIQHTENTVTIRSDKSRDFNVYVSLNYPWVQNVFLKRYERESSLRSYHSISISTHSLLFTGSQCPF
jgi:hypothetical protein